MFRLTLRTARANLTRSLLSTLAVVLGVAFVSGTLMFTDGLKTAMTGYAAAKYRNIDVEVSPRLGSSIRPPDDMLDRVRRIEGVRAAEATWSLYALGLAAGDGRKIGGEHRAVNVASDPALRPYEASIGRMPEAAGEVVLDERTAGREHLTVGDKLQISGEGKEAGNYTLVGLTTTTKDAMGSAGALIVMTTSDLEAIADYPSTTIVVAADDGLSDAALAARIGATVDAEVLTHDQLVQAALDNAVGDAATFRNALLSFGAIAVSMAAFVIANTFTIVLAQRSRETALLRLLGATRKQVFRSAIMEAVVISLGGSLIGLALGVLLAYGLPATLTAIGASAQVSPIISGRTALVALAVGTGVTVLSALLPARRGTRVAPVTALSDAAVHLARPISRGRRVWGILTAGAGIAGLAAADSANQIGVSVAGMLVALLGFLLLSPVLVPALVRVVGRPVATLGGATVRLALANAVRNPRRIATTTNALVVGVTLVATFALITKSAEAPAERTADEKLFAQFLVIGTGDWSVLPVGVLDALRKQPELGTAIANFQSYDDKNDYEVQTGREHDPAGGPGRDSAVVSADLGIAAGGTVTVQGRPFTVASVAPGTRTVWLTAENITQLFDEPRLAEVQVDPAPGVSVSDARVALDRALLAFPSVVAYDHAGYVAKLNATLNQALVVVTALLALAVIIALIGVANTLTLSVVERTRENALLRAIGLTRRQLRHTLAAEALVMALTGTLIGIAAGVAVTLSTLGAVDKQGSGFDLAIPWDQLAALLAVAVLAALAASVLPARRAVRLPVATNLAAE